MGDIYTGTIVDFSTVTIYSTMTMTTPTIFSTSNMDSGIGVSELRTVRGDIITTTFVAFVAICTNRVAIIICPLFMCCVSFSNSDFSERRPMTILEKFSIIILKIPTNPNLDVFCKIIFIFSQMRVFEIIHGFHFIGIGIVIKNIMIENIT